MKTIIIIVLVLASLGTGAQITFNKQYGGPVSENGQAVRQLSSQGYAVIGSSIVSTGSNSCLLFTNEFGDSTGFRMYGGLDDTWSYSFEFAHDEGFIIAGSIQDSGSSRNIYLVKTDPSGNIQWTKSIGDSLATETAFSVKQTNDLGYIAVGSRFMPFDPIATKVDVNGNTVWTHTYGGASLDGFYFISLASNNGFVFSGYTESYGTYPRSFYIVRVNDMGDTLWTGTYGYFNYNSAYGIIPTLDHGFVIVGITSHMPIPNTENDILLIKIDSLGNQLWKKVYGGIYDDLVARVAELPDGSLVMAGSHQLSPGGNYSALIMKTNSGGDTIWTKSHGGQGNVYASDMDQTSDLGYIICGTVADSAMTDTDIFLMKLDSKGELITMLKDIPGKERISCYPNPAKNILQVRGLEQDEQCRLLTFDGRVMLETSSSVIDVSSLEKGVYLLVVTNSSGKTVCTRKLIRY